MPNFNNFYPNLNNYSQYPRPQLNQYAFVNGIEGAKSFQMMPNQTMLLMDSDNPICYMKISNNMGQSTLRYFTLEEIDETKAKKIVNTKPKETIIEYASKNDISTLNKRLDDLTALIKKQLGDKDNV